MNADPARAGLATVLREWGRIGCVGFGGPPAHVALLRRLCVERRGWLTPADFEDGVAATNLLPGPASTQLAIYTAWRVGGWPAAVVGGLCFIVPGFLVILGLAALFLSGHPPLWVRGAAAGAGAAVAAVAVRAAIDLLPSSWRRARVRARWVGYVVLGAVATVLVGPYLVLVLLACGLVELICRRAVPDGARVLGMPVAVGLPSGGLVALSWVAVKVGALSYGGGFVIIPLMHADAVDRYGWMSEAQFLDAVAFGQITPGPVVLTMAVVGYAAAGVLGAVLATVLAFGPSFAMVIGGAPRFDRLRGNRAVQAFLDGAGPAAIGAIGGSAVLLAGGIAHLWQAGVLALAALWLLAANRGVVSALVGAGVIGAIAVVLGAPLVS